MGSRRSGALVVIRLGAPAPIAARTRLIIRLRGEGRSLREIADRVGVSEKAIRKQLRRLGWPAAKTEQTDLLLPESVADPNLSGSAAPVEDPAPGPSAVADPNLSGSAAPVEELVSGPAPGADPNLSGSAIADEPPLVVSADRDPADRWGDRVLAKLGLLDDAAPLFRDGERVPRAGVLLALPAIAQAGVVDTAREVYGSIGPAFYGLRTTIVALVFLALLRIKRPEALKEHAPPDLGRLLGLDRAPEVKTLRRKLTRLAGFGRATEFGRRLAQRRVRGFGDAMGFPLHRRPRPRLPRQAHAAEGAPCAHADRDAGDDRLLGQRCRRRAAVRCHDRSQRRPGQDAPRSLQGDPRPRRRTPRDDRLRPRRLEPQAVPEAHRRRLRHPHLPQGQVATASALGVPPASRCDRRTQGRLQAR